ncbi:hypothetical protein [Streptomyces halstedii]|uniref:Uncharacterized protein n=1 Tax=Streptomyces halstedii TaxID=1944 RepID=A0A6N9TZ87_STRHA|nr:hypothetical protein [Streptomyces halstedii]NEA16698.1 hypothetical protein [Streptomyces halstedii]
MPNEIAPREHRTSLSETSLSELRGDCARMAPRWIAAAGRTAVGPVDAPRIHGVTVPPGSARLIDAMADYGD